jgi:D-alanine-D-alanine ligase-like ATP-grasp enzyme
MRLLRLERLLARLRKAWEIKRKASRQVYVHDRVAEYRALWQAAAAEIGARLVPLADDLWELSLDGKTTRIFNHCLQFDDPVILETAGNKPLVYRMLRERGLRVPEHAVFHLEQLHEAEPFLRRHATGCVVKPASGTSSGLGITTHVLTRKDLRAAAVLASLYASQLLIERMIPGESYRLLVLDGEVIHAVRRRGLRLVGDGISPIAELIRAENRRRAQRAEPAIGTGRDCAFTLDYQGLALSSTPSRDQSFLVQTVNDPMQRHVEVRTVYDESVTDLLCHAIKKAAGVVAQALHSRFIGVDVITTDPSVPLEESGGAIIEANTTPGLHHHYDFKRERFPQPAPQVLRTLLDG